MNDPVGGRGGVPEAIATALRQPSFLRVMLVLAATVVVLVGIRLGAPVLSVVYHIVPDTDRSFWFATPGAVFAVIAWAIASLGFSFYLANFANRGLTYGSLGTAVGLLVYLYLSASVVLLGAEIKAAVYRIR